MDYHNLKITPENFAAVVNKTKKAELRKDDRDFKVGDIVMLHEFENNEITGELILVKITHILDDQRFIPPGLVMLSIDVIE